MKKISLSSSQVLRGVLFLVALVTTLSTFAQAPTGTMNFVGKSEYTATVGTQTISGGAENDVLSMPYGYATLTFPAMTVKYMGTDMTVPSMTINLPAPTMSGNPMQGTAVFTWDKAATDTIIDFPGIGNKTVKITSLHAVFTQSTKTLETTYVFQYGSMPGVVTFTETGVYSPTAIESISADTAAGSQNRRTCKAMVGGKLVIVKNGKQYNAAGVQMK